MHNLQGEKSECGNREEGCQYTAKRNQSSEQLGLVIHSKHLLGIGTLNSMVQPPNRPRHKRRKHSRQKRVGKKLLRIQKRAYAHLPHQKHSRQSKRTKEK